MPIGLLMLQNSFNDFVLEHRSGLKTYLFDLAFPPVGTVVPIGLLMLQNSFNDFVLEHRSGRCTTEPGYTGDIGAIEFYLLID